ncbi:uncharacterized protein LOC133520636 [Cydia pomonella]|uniref:uncharacterized protein LOC133520636 n=1 Tax=Cydia pomonella TaxID=82600 RepID=UPI002ADE4FD6|nr:uncharacterized protein LOC133520636 [Cydia pomonella]
MDSVNKGVRNDHNYVSLSEVGCRGPDIQGTNNVTVDPPRTDNGSANFFGNMETLLSRLLAATQNTPSVHAQAKFVKFDPDETDADIQGWCNVTEFVVNSRNLAGPELLLALTHALKGRAAKCLTSLKVDDLTWPRIKETLLARFNRQMLMQDYFDDILKFQIGSKESATEAAVRLWNLIERVPKVDMNEEVVTGFAISVLSQKDPLIRRDLNSHVISTRAQLCRILGGISLKRRHDDHETNEVDSKKTRPNSAMDTRFSCTCHFCGNRGHKIEDCRKRRDSIKPKEATKIPDKEKEKICFTCGKPGHISTTCPDGKKKPASETIARKEVHICERRSARDAPLGD